MKNITLKMIEEYKNYLINEEKSKATINKYMHDILCFTHWLNEKELVKGEVLAYKKYLLENYAISSTNSIISSLNSCFDYFGYHDLKVKTIKTQKQIFASDKKQLTKAEYERLLMVAQRKSQRLYLLIQCVCSTGLRISELEYITVETVEAGMAEIDNKGKIRTVFLPSKLCKMLKEYIEEQKIKSGAVFITKTGKPLDRSNIWVSMKKLCKEANVSEEKVYPHNLRHLFARTYYKSQKDIVRLSDILGHSNINTTRIYTKESGTVHRQQIQKLGLLL